MRQTLFYGVPTKAEDGLINKNMALVVVVLVICMAGHICPKMKIGVISLYVYGMSINTVVFITSIGIK